MLLTYEPELPSEYSVQLKSSAMDCLGMRSYVFIRNFHVTEVLINNTGP